MADVIGVGLDLGSDTLKVAYAYGKSTGYGKFMDDKRSTGVGIPAIAYYDESKGKWLYGDEVDVSGGESFVTVVKIRELMKLVSPAKSEETTNENIKYYRERDIFPKFTFPVRSGVSADFGEIVRRDMAFRAEGWTPELVCEGYFAYVAAFTQRDVEELPCKGEKKVKLALVYPPTADKAYVTEYKRLAEKAFGMPADKVLVFAKALGMYAYETGMISSGESLLIFDMGESAVSVAKASLMSGNVVVDGVDGHNEPMHMGGGDVDSAIAAYLNDEIKERETVGYPSYGQDGHITEKFLHSKLYLLMKEIKGAKIMLSSERADEGRAFADGVPVSVCCDLYIERILTRAEMAKACGVTDDTGVARAISDYILSELKRPVNRGVKKVFLSGGLTETYAFTDYIHKKARAKFPDLKFYPVDPTEEKPNNGFNIMRNEDSVYAPAVGGAIVALKNYNVRTAIALTYATWVTWKDDVCLAIIADRGMQLAGRVKEYPYPSTFAVSGKCIRNEKIFSAVITTADIAARSFPGLSRSDFIDGPTAHLKIGNEGSSERQRIAKAIGLKTVSGENGATINYYHNGAQVEITEGAVACIEGMKISPDGRAKPFIRNAEVGGNTVKIRYMSRPVRNGRPDRSVDMSVPVTVYAKDIYVGFVGIDDVIDVVVG